VSGLLLKVEGAGNDFVLATGGWAGRLTDQPGLVPRLCHRQRGIGADGVLIVRVTGPNHVRLGYRNADGSDAAFCANATRCAARVANELLGLGPDLQIATAWADIRAVVRGTQVTLHLPAPDGCGRPLELAAAGRRWPGWSITLGVPHFIVPVDDIDTLDLTTICPPLRHHPALGTDGANVSFVARADDGAAVVRTWERGVEGETLACGSAIVATALVLMAAGGSGDRRLRCRSRSGDELVVEACSQPSHCSSRLTGPTRIVAHVSPTEELLEPPRRTP
jgi:diaminopimelate epimerase